MDRSGKKKVLAGVFASVQGIAWSRDGKELWFTSDHSGLGYTGPAIFRSIKQPNGIWGPPEEIISNFAGESTMDADGNIYFVHHYYEPPNLIEADIYVAYKQ